MIVVFDDSGLSHISYVFLLSASQVSIVYQRLWCFRLFFFFSSRRRHTRSLCDWSSDVCSSDLRCPDILLADEAFGHLDEVTAGELRETFLKLARECGSTAVLITHQLEEAIGVEIGRASCRERV